MLKKLLFAVIFLTGIFMNSQDHHQNHFELNTKYPQNYFQSPVEIPIVLAATFGELRTNHFHAGIDIKTQHKEGLNVLSVANGYVSRIKIKHWGYGKAIYVKHPNGYTSVYAHLSKFSPKIEAYIKKQQYKKESYEIQLYPNANTLTLKKGELLAFSGNSGGSTAPHLHFEIRDSSTEKIINPLLFGIKVNDHKKPVIQAAYIYQFDDLLNESNKQKIQFSKQENGNLLANTVYANGEIGLGIKSFDRLDDANNKNGLYKLELLVNKQKIYQHKLETFSFAEGKYVNLLVDFPHKFFKKERIQKCFVVPNNKLSIYNDLINKGRFFINNGQEYNIEIIASDISGNQTKLIIPIIGQSKKPLVTLNSVLKNKISSTKKIFRNKFNSLNKENVTLAIPKYSFYQDVDFNFEYQNGIAVLHDGSIPLHKNFTLTFNTKDYTAKEKEKLFIASVNKNGYLSYVYTKRKENKLYINSKKLGSYKLASDIVKPTIKPKNFSTGQWLTHSKTLKVKIKDDLSGIKSYRATIDNQWILMEYEPKTGILTYDLNDKKFTQAKHTLKIVVSDQVNNTKTYIATFYRKK